MIFTEHVRLFHDTLFSGFPREVGFPARHSIESFDKFLELAHAFHKSSPVLIQLYRLDEIKDEVEIDKLWVDFDSINQYKLMSDLKTVYNRTVKFGFPKEDIVPAFTGVKGFHIYAKINPRTYPIEEAKDFLHWINSYLCRDLETPDFPLFGDVNRMVRTWGIQRPEGTIMIGLSPQHIFKYNTINDYFVKHKFAWKKLIHIGSQYLKRMNGGAILELGELKDEIKSTGFKPPKPTHSINSHDKTSSISPITKKGGGEYFDFLRLVLGDTPLFYAIHAPNPRHNDRVRFVRRLLFLKLSIDHCMDICESFSWRDWDPEVTAYQLENIKNKYNL